MGRLAYILFALAALGAATVLFMHMTTPITLPAKTVELRIGSTTVVAEVADTPDLRALGLGGRAHLEEGRGMWFVFDEDGLWSFWMKDTLIPLDIIWVAPEGTVVHIAHEVQPQSYPEAFAPTVPARFVLEVPGGWAKRHGIAEGQKIVVQ